ncbi:hypothetical protein THAOC_08180 [Thalassiosira oceanica]|uniref:Uncharacterized protein n=1 Tax=Thalassiosira oceanica TaxID=159749 RepID=K0SYH9_THAOC|nr:hypothetical protein THAOC_08180 [Thalassiosira oceanica]|eukprot:EJK70460.1 hypothetical protein THAOC_08180 [Thalassiosira oceanica]
MRAELIDIENALETASPPASRTIRKADMLPRAAWVLIEIVMRESVLPLGGLWVSGRSAWARQGIVATSWITAGCIAGPSHTCSKDKHKTNDTYLRLDPTRRVGPASGDWRQGVTPGCRRLRDQQTQGRRLRRSSLLKLSNSQIKTWARHAASGDLGATISRESPPTGTGQHSNTDRKGGSFPIMHQQFLRAVGVRAVTGNAALKLSRIYNNMYTTCGQRNENRREAAHAAKTQI